MHEPKKKTSTSKNLSEEAELLDDAQLQLEKHSDTPTDFRSSEEIARNQSHLHIVQSTRGKVDRSLPPQA